MRMRRLSAHGSRLSAYLLLLLLLAPYCLAAQSREDQMRGPRFLLASAERGQRLVPVDVSKTPMLRRRLSLNLENVPLKKALAIVTQQSGLELVYSDDLLPNDAHVTLRADGIALAAALTDILLDANVDVVFTRDGRASLAKRSLSEALAAVGTVTGRVSDALSGDPVTHAQVNIVGTSLGRATDDSGRYAIVGVVAGSHQVNARRVGYAPLTLTVDVADGATATVDFRLQRVATTLSAMVTTVTGEQRRLEVGNAIATIRADSTVERAPVRDLGDLINGRAAGVQVMFQNGVVGQSPSIRVRGTNSITVSNDPIVIIDGVRVENGPGRTGGITGSGPAPTAGRLADINPEEIATLEVVKGPSAATLYGTDAANGVIVITTKRGEPGATQWNAFGEQGLSQQADAKWPTNYYAWGHSVTTGAVQQCLLVARAAGTCVQDSLTTFNPLRDSPNSPLRGTGYRQLYGLQASGGSNNLRYFLGGDLEDETGYLRLSDAERNYLRVQRGGAAIPDWQVQPNALRKTSLRANATAALAQDADAGVSVGYVRSNTLMPSTSLLQSAVWGTGNADTLRQWGSIIPRPAYAFADKQEENVSHFLAGATVNWRTREWLLTHATVGLDWSSDDFEYLIRRGDTPTNTLGRRLQQVQDVSLYTVDVGATGSWPLRPDVSARTSVGGQYNRRNSYTTGAAATGLAPGSETVTGAATVSGFETGVQTVVAGGYLEQVVSYRERVFLTGALRLDAGSSFGTQINSALYPKAGISWLLLDGSRASFADISTLRLRAAFGSSGVQPNAIASRARDSLFTSLVSGVTTNGATLVAPGNANLRPERQTEVEGGVDVEAFHNRARLELTAYNRQSADALIDVPFAGAFGLGRGAVRQINIGAVRNRGIEGQVSVRALEARDITWDIGFNGNINQNRLLRLAPDVPRIGTRIFFQKAGYPINGLWERPILSYADANNNSIIEPSEVKVAESVAFFGPVLPPRQLITTTTLGFLAERLRINALLDYRGGNKRWNGTLVTRCLNGLQACREVNDPATPLDLQAAAVAANNFGFATAGYFEDGSFLKFRELSISYTSDRVAKALRARRSLLTLSGRNLATFTRYTGVDPEGTSNVGLDANSDNPIPYPARYFIARVTLGY